MTKIKCFIGISNSGKSTMAHKEWLKDPLNTIVLSRDKIRNLLWNYNDENVFEYYTHPDFNKLEKEVSKYCDTLVYEAIEGNKIIILDNTHLDFKRDIQSLEYWNVPVELVWFDITLKEALTRNMSRNRKVDESIISKQYSKYVQLRKDVASYSFSPKIFENDINKPLCWIFDIDGTLAHNTGSRSPYDWKRVTEDSKDYSICSLFNSLNSVNTHQVIEPLIFCSGRDESCRKETEEWLCNNLDDASLYKLYMRKEGDNRADYIIKEELWREIAENYYIGALIDDRNQVCRRARALGLKVLQVEYGNF